MKPMMKNTLALSLLTVMSVTAPLLAVDALEMETTKSCSGCLVLDRVHKLTGRQPSRSFSPSEIIETHLATPMGASKARYCSLTTASTLEYFDCMELNDVIEDARQDEYAL